MKLKLFLKNLTRDAKRLKILIVCALLLLESLVLIGAAFDRMPPVGVIGGADGPTSIIISKSDSNRLLDWLIHALVTKTDKKPQQEKEEPQDEKGDTHLEGNGPSEQEESGHLRTDLPDATEQQRKEAAEKGLLVLINKQNPVDKDYKPDDLTSIKYYASNRSEAGRYMRKEAADQFHKLVEAAASEGYELVMTTAYRSYGFQQILWNNYVANEGEAAASRFSAKPGQSEHQSGLAVDVSAPSVDYALTESFGKTEEGIWLAQNAYKFGFIIRFPEGKESITGYLYEPWHIRYVGKPVAAEIYAKGLTLEEYLALYESNPNM